MSWERSRMGRSSIFTSVGSRACLALWTCRPLRDPLVRRRSGLPPLEALTWDVTHREASAGIHETLGILAQYCDPLRPDDAAMRSVGA